MSLRDFEKECPVGLLERFSCSLPVYRRRQFTYLNSTFMRRSSGAALLCLLPLQPVGIKQAAAQPASASGIVSFNPQAQGQRIGVVELTNTSGAVVAIAHVFCVGLGPMISVPQNTSLSPIQYRAYSGGGEADSDGAVAVDTAGNVLVADHWRQPNHEIYRDRA